MPSSILAFAAIALVVVLVPGADTILVLRTSLRDGTRAGTITASGVICGPVIWGTLAGIGIALVLNRNTLTYSAIAGAGGFYLSYLAYRMLLSARTTWRSGVAETLDDPARTTPARRSTAHFFTGLTTNLLNPKIGVFYVSVMPGLFLGQQITAWLGALLGAIHAVIGLVFLGSVAALSGAAGKYLTRPKVQAGIELACGLCLLGFGAFVLVEATVRLRILG